MDYQNEIDWREAQAEGWFHFQGKPWSILDILDKQDILDESKFEPQMEQKSFVVKGGSGAMEHKVFSAEVKEFDDEELIVTHFISTERRDRAGDLMKADGMRVNGKVVVLMAHGFSGMAQEPIAKPLKIWPASFQGSPGICARTQFYDGSHLNPPDSTGQRLYEKAKDGFMPNWSIGYIALKWTDGKGPDGRDYRDVHEWELLEYSPVGVPMNPDCQNVERCGSCQKESWFKVCPTNEAISTKAFEHYKPPVRVQDTPCYIRGKYLCTFGQLGEKISELQAEVIRKEFRRVTGKID